MKYYIQVREDRRNSTTGLAPVVILFMEGRKKFVVTTDVSVKGKLDGVNVSSSEPNSKAKTRKLIRLTDEIDEYLLDCYKDDFEVKKTKLKSIVTGEEYSVAKSLADFIDKYADTKTKEGTKELFLLTSKKVAAFNNKSTFQDVDKTWLDKFVSSLGKCQLYFYSPQEH